MKVLNKFILIFALAFSFSACEDFIGGDLNADPNKPTSVPIIAQMAAIQINIADVYGGAFSRFNCMLSQQVEGVARQWQSMNQYTGLTPNRFDAAWNNVYENILIELKVAQQSALDQGYNHYQGVLQIMEALILMTATDVWDDMPYSDALQGVESINPTFDTQATIYSTVGSLLDESIKLFGGASGGLVPGSEELYFAGDIDAWLRVAHALKARKAMKEDDYALAMSEAMQAMDNADGNLAFQYPDASAAGQWYRFNRDRTGDLEFHPTMRALMTDLQDTVRLAAFDQVFTTDHTYMTADFLQELITFREVQFIIAEADLRTAGGTQAGYDAYLAGIKASFDRIGLGQAEYEAYVAQPEVAPGVGNLTLDMVLTQKYIAMFLQPEVYSDWRRTGIPALTPTNGSVIPVRWDYSSTEYLFNTNSPAETEVSIYNDKVGWNR